MEALKQCEEELDYVKSLLTVLQETIAKLEYENASLKRQMIHITSRIAVYIPVKGSEVDMRLAEWINNYPDRSRLKIMFIISIDFSSFLVVLLGL